MDMDTAPMTDAVNLREELEAVGIERDARRSSTAS